jgi:hypothetical protein
MIPPAAGRWPHRLARALVAAGGARGFHRADLFFLAAGLLDALGPADSAELVAALRRCPAGGPSLARPVLRRGRQLVALVAQHNQEGGRADGGQQR